jgi:Phage tail assembly chaperone protein
MADFIVYDSLAGAADARPLRGWGSVPDGLEGQQAVASGEVSVVAPATPSIGDLVEGTGYTYDPALGTIATGAAASAGVSTDDVRREIGLRLRDSEWTQLPDAPVVSVIDWASYRAALRAVPQQANYPDNVNWPTPPSDTEY